MPSLFGRRKCPTCATAADRPMVVDSARGESGMAVAILQNVPALSCSCGASRTYAYADLGHDLRQALLAASSATGVIRVALDARGLAKVQVEVRLGDSGERTRAIESDIGDALIAAFESVALRP